MCILDDMLWYWCLYWFGFVISDCLCFVGCDGLGWLFRLAYFVGGLWVLGGLVVWF